MGIVDKIKKWLIPFWTEDPNRKIKVPVTFMGKTEEMEMTAKEWDDSLEGLLHAERWYGTKRDKVKK